MLNGIGSSTSTAIGTQRGADAKQAGAAATRTDASQAGAAGQGVSTTIGRLAAEGAPVETDRVAALRAAIKGGQYQIDPDALATKMIASDLG